MKKYAAVYLGTRWGQDYPWGITVEADGKPPILLCVGCAEERAKELVTLLNSRQENSRRTGKLAAAVAVLLAAVLFSGCTIAPLKGGKATTSKSTQGIEQSVVQGDNPAAASRQDQETVRTKSYTVPVGSRMVETHVTADTGGALVTNASALLLSAPMFVTEREETRASSELGAAQKDTARELSAKLASLKGIVWVGVVVFLFGLASMFYPPLQLIIGSVTTSLMITAGGVALMILPSLVVGNELLILAGVAAAVGLYFFAHRHGKLRGLVDAAKDDIK
ncbi:MAG: hypothetical protein WCK57_13320 [Verrucomicrobiae bacterium]